MRFMKLLGLLAVAAAILMAYAGVASATTATSPTGTTYTSTIKATAGKITITGSFSPVSCSSSAIETAVEQHGAGTTVGGWVSLLNFGGCSHHVTVLKAGALDIDGISGTYNGTVTSTGAEIEIITSVGKCVFTTNNTDIGTLTGGNGAKIDVVSQKIPRTGGNFLCGSSGTLDVFGGYSVTTPGSFYIDP